MEATWQLRIGYFLVSFPLMLFACVARRCNLWEIRNQLCYCMRVVDIYSACNLPDSLVQILIVAEDRRNLYHFGIDPIGILRAVWVNSTTVELQGASSLEQQFVRVVTARYEKSMRRKLKEQLLAISLCRKRSKIQIATAYLCIAHYGCRLVGLRGLHSICGQPLEKCSNRVLCEVVARLKYPEPSIVSLSWRHNIELRSRYIAKRRSIKSHSLSFSQSHVLSLHKAHISQGMRHILSRFTNRWLCGAKK